MEMFVVFIKGVGNDLMIGCLPAGMWVYGFDEETWDGETCKSVGFESLRDSEWLKSMWHVEIVVNSSKC